MNNKLKTILFTGLITVMILPFSTMDIVDAIPNQHTNDNAFKKVNQVEQTRILKIDAQQLKSENIHKNEYSRKSLAEKELPNLGQNWEVISVDYSGVEEPFELTGIIVTAKLIDNPNNPHQCKYGTIAVITYDVKTGRVLEKNIPNFNECKKPITLSRQITSVNLPDFIPQAVASSNRAYLTAEQGNDQGHYGGYGKINVPRLDESPSTTVFSEMDSFVYFGYNQEINGKFFQVGWLIDDSLGKLFVFADENTYGNLNAHGIYGIPWTNNGDATVYIQCGNDNDYFIYLYHSNQWFTHDTNYDCDNTTDNSINNSVWLENANTVSTSEWSDEIETSVKAWNMKEFDTKYSVSNWSSSSNTYENCPSGSGSTNNISSSLGSGGTSIWTVSGIDDC